MCPFHNSVDCSQNFRSHFLSSRNLLTLVAFDPSVGNTKREVGMRRVLLTTVALIASATVTAVAADLPRAMPAKAPAFVPVGYNWTGFYVGINGGYGWGSSNWGGFVGRGDPSRGVGGG